MLNAYGDHGLELPHTVKIMYFSSPASHGQLKTFVAGAGTRCPFLFCDSFRLLTGYGFGSKQEGTEDHYLCKVFPMFSLPSGVVTNIIPSFISNTASMHH
jgi:hypothetical protein